MRLKTFKASSMMNAMKLINEELGDDAIIVTSREDSDGSVQVTAAIENLPNNDDQLPSGFDLLERQFEKNTDNATTLNDDNEEEGTSPLLQRFADDDGLGDDSGDYKSWFDELAEFEPDSTDDNVDFITEAFIRHKLPSSVSDKLINTALALESHEYNSPQKILAQTLAQNFTFEPLAETFDKPLALVGPPGAGKTLTIAKLAARAKLDLDQNVVVITTDTNRAGAVEQLAAFINLLDIKLHDVSSASELKTLLRSKACKEADQILIDTGGINPYSPSEMKELARFLSAVEMETFLVLPAACDADESAEMALTFGVLGVKKLLPTRLDFARRLGGLLTAADRANMIFTDASHTHKVADGLIHLDEDILAKLLLSGSQKR